MRLALDSIGSAIGRSKADEAGLPWLVSGQSEQVLVTYRIRLLETDEGWSVSCLDLPGCHSQGTTREDALANIREAIGLWLEVEAEEAGVKHAETLELAL